MMALLKGSIKLITDSGGLQKEAYELGIPCITVRETTEWVETLKGNMNILTMKDIHNFVEKKLIYRKDKIFMDRSYEKIVKNIL